MKRVSRTNTTILKKSLIPTPKIKSVPPRKFQNPVLLESQQVSKPIAESVPEPIAETVPEPIAEAVPEPIAEPVPEPIAELVPEPIAEAVPEPMLKSVSNSKTVKINSVTSKVTINFSNGIVTKHVHAYTNYKVFEREVYWLRYLNNKKYDWCPKLVDSNSKTRTIYMEYVGKPICKGNAPSNWRSQLQKILTDLQKENIKHNDIKCAEVLVKEGKLYLIDYGWASCGTDWSCGQGFNKRPKPCHNFPDHTAMARIEKAIR